MTTPPPTVGYAALFRGNPDFRNLFVGRLVSLFGDWFNLLAILAMLRAFGDDSAMGFAVVLVLKTLPAILAPFAGVLADRLPRRSLMVFADAGRALVVLAMAGLAWAPSVSLLYLLVVAQTMLSAVFEPARHALLPDIVRPEELTAANAISSASWSLMLAVGASTGGLFTDLLGWQLALLLDAGTYVTSAWFLLQIREPEVERLPRPLGGVLDWIGVTDLWWGARWMARRPKVWTLALVKPIWQLTGARLLVLTLLGETAFLLAGWPMLSVSALYVSRGIGTGIGPFLSRWLTQSEPVAMERAIVIALALSGLGYLGLGFAPNLWVAGLLLVLAHIGGSTTWVFSAIRLQQITPSAVRGRVFAAEHAGLTFVMAASTGVFGRMGDHLPSIAPAWLGADPMAASARLMAIALGVITVVPFVFWVGRGAVLGWGGDEETLELRP